jgi:thioester reductase-like protein
MTQTVVPEAHIESTIAAVARRRLRSATPFHADTPFALLGIDSLGTIEMAAALEEALGCDLPPDVLAGCDDARALAARITQLRDRSVGARQQDPFDQMLADAMLPDDVRPMRIGARSTDLRRAKRILLTGATGFLGGALLEELLAASDGDIVCIVRHPLTVGRTLRLDAPRIHVVTGDLSQPGLGMSERHFDDLARDVDAVVHCGAAVNWVYSYAHLRDANVLGTLELLRLAAIDAIPFHFVSSLSVCYSSEGPRNADETFDALPHIRGVHLGYAQTKVVAEALVREAARRGLPARVYRPPLISGHSSSGAYNRDDLIAALVRGCVHMGTAPDLDWKLDCQPVDFVARAIVQLSGESRDVLHLGHPRPRHWRECVLWMRMYGYPLRLVPYHTWLRQLDRETRSGACTSAQHPLRPLRTFFLDRRGDTALTLPELYDEARRTRACSTTTQARLAAQDVTSPPLDASLLDIYFRAFRSGGDLPAPRASSARQTSNSLSLDRDLFNELLHDDVRRVRMIGSGSDHSIVSELTAWRSGRASGLFRVDVELANGLRKRLRLKAKAADRDVTAVGESLAGLVDPTLGRLYARWSDRIGFAMSHHREIHIYRQTDARFTTHVPALLGSVLDDTRERWLLALEEIDDAVLRDSADDPSAWHHSDVAAALDGLAALHAIWYGRETELRSMPWIGHVQSSAGMEEMSDLWRALARHASPSFSSWASPDISAIQDRLIESIDRWWPSLEAAPRTLIHNDFNPRNVCLRTSPSRLIAYDWELATVGAPQHDLAEFLCFVLTSETTAPELRRWIDYYRVALEAQTGGPVDQGTWMRGFRAALCDLLLNRLATYAVVHRVRQQAFLPRVLRTWHRLYALTCEERA